MPCSLLLPPCIKRLACGAGSWIACSVLVTASLGSVGCSAVRDRLAVRSNQCEELCDQAKLASDDGQAAQANRILDAAVQQRPVDLETRFQLAETLWDSGRQSEATATFEKLWDQNPHDARLAATLARTRFETGLYDDAYESAVEALELDPYCVSALEIKARVEQRREHFDLAVATWHRVTQADPTQIEAHQELARLQLNLGQPDYAACLLRSTLNQPNLTVAQFAEVQWLLGRSYAQSERWNDAAEALNKGAEFRQPTSDDWYLLAYVREKSGDPTGALAALDSSLKLKPHHSGALALRTRLLPQTASIQAAGYKLP